MSAHVHLGYGEHLIFVGHEVAIVCEPDLDTSVDPDELHEEQPEAVYFAEDWKAACAPSAVIDEDGDVAFLNSNGKPYRWVKPRIPRCASEIARAERLFARTFDDAMRVRS